MGSSSHVRSSSLSRPRPGFSQRLAGMPALRARLPISLPVSTRELEKVVQRFLLTATALSVFLVFVIFFVLGPGGTWAFFSGTADQMFGITTGFWPTPTPQPGTSLAAEKTAQGFWEQREVQERVGARGQVCATNPGDFPTRDLAIVDTVQIKLRFTQYADYASFPVDVSARPVLAPGETFCYPYEVTFLQVPEAKYRNTARVTITNHSGWLPGSKHCPGPQVCPFGPMVRAGFSLPDAPTILQVPENPAPPRLGLISPTPEPTRAATQQPTDTPEPPSLPSPTPTPSPSLTPPDSPTPAEPQHSTPTSAPTLERDSTCVFYPDYWKDHPGDWPVREIHLGDETYARKQARELLELDPGEDATLLLARQLIAARLNVANGADGEPVAALLEESDAWLVDHPLFSDPDGQARKQGKSFAEEIEDYNTGKYGPPACPSGKATPTNAPTLELLGTPTPAATATFPPTATWGASPTLAPTETPLTHTPTPLPTETPEPVPPTPTTAHTQAPVPTETEPPPLVTEEPTPLPW